MVFAWSTARSCSGCTPITLRLGLQAVGEHDRDALGAGDHVQVGEDDAVVDDHHAGAALRLAARGDVGVGRVRQAPHKHHGRQDAFVGVGDGGYRVLLVEDPLDQRLDLLGGHAARTAFSATGSAIRTSAWGPKPGGELQAPRVALAPGTGGCAGAAGVGAWEPGTLRTCCRPPPFSWKSRVYPPDSVDGASSFAATGVVGSMTSVRRTLKRQPKSPV